MSLNKKVVWLPYDMDTAIGSDNQGALIFNYNLEDTDMIGTEGVFNGSTNVMWNNMRDAFPNEIQTMYQNLRSSGALSYDLVEQMFENHQNKWPEAIFNEDAIYKYIQPLINDNDGQYLSMALGSKAEQRKWWLYNRFKYIDSKYSGGESLTDVITLRPGALDSGITITPYADIYVAVRWDNDTAKIRATRGVPTTIVCPYSTVGNNVVNILNASQLSSVGDLSGFKCRSANFVKASRLQYIKVGDSADGYDNPNLLELLIGNNTLLTTVDARNCSSLTATIDLSGASNIEEAYFDGTKIAGVSLPNGGILRVLHLPNTVRNLTIRNQSNIEDFTMNDYSMISTLRLENCGIVMDEAIDIINDMQQGNIRLVGIDWDFDDGADFKTTFDKINSCGGLDDTDIGFPTAVAQLQGAVHTPSASSSYFNTLQSRYPYVTFTADELTNMVKQLLEGTLTEYEDDEVETVSACAFSNITTLTKINIPNVVGVIGDYAFNGCSNLVGDIVFENVTYVNTGAFQDCSKITSLYIGGNNSGIGAYAVRKCSMLKEIRFPKAKSLFAFGGYGLSGDYSLELIDFGGANQATFNNLESCPLHTLILRKTSICTLGSSTLLDNSAAFKNGGTGGEIYIPEALYNHLGDGSSSDYKAASNWSVYDAYGTITWKKIEGSEYELEEVSA